LKEKKKKIITGKRKIIRVGDSVAVTLPREWLERHGLEVGDEIGIVANAILKIVTVQEVD